MKFKFLCAASLCLAFTTAMAGPDTEGSLSAISSLTRFSTLETRITSNEARFAFDWVAAHADNQGKPFVIVDKKSAQMYVFEADGKLISSTPVLLGAGVGDFSVPGIETRDISTLRQEERTTPAGRFVSEPGRNLTGEDIIWVDYSAKIAIHRLRPDAALQQRAQRLGSGLSDDKRVSLGCIVVPVSFYENVIRPVLGKRYGLVYVLPETRPVQSMFGAYDLTMNRP
ncbi:MAG: L,D-transpeptidase [Polaromonas sp.]|nr:L,D-transpeptidase [Polaromonas sp.]